MHQVIETTVYGRRRKLLVRDDMPLFYPNLWITYYYPKNSVGTQKLYLGHLAMFEGFLEYAKIDLTARLNARPESSYLGDGELSEFVNQAGMASSTRRYMYAGSKLFPTAYQKIGADSFQQRIEVVRDYLKFLYDELGDSNSKREAIANVESRLNQKIKASRPSYKRRKIKDTRGLTDAQRKRIREVMHPDSLENPFSSEATKHRNYIILELGLQLGLRRSEMLLIKLSDIVPKEDDPSTFLLKLVALEDESIDPRKEAPQFKTHERMIQLSDRLVRDIHTYTVKYRKCSSKNPFLLVSHGRGAGSPLAISGIDNILPKVIEVAPELAGISPHTLRHDCVYTLLASMQEDLKALTPEDRATQVQKVLTWMFGWSPESNMPELYGAKFWHEAANEAVRKRAERFSISTDDGGDL
ncbi:tyrosine-type recombinase/integrase [Vibrio ostreicida]|uniref:tyrosine-type recombinase/integrase n=1 Tax=Vibrio ostreicida TaxID=526588 RepID=UPI003B58D1B4